MQRLSSRAGKGECAWKSAMQGWRKKLIGGLAALFLAGLFPAAAQDKRFGPFRVDAAAQAILLNGEIDAGAALNFRRALAAAPRAKRVVLNSPGGLVPIALLIADDVDQRGLLTEIPAGSYCYSACSYIFLAGRERLALGELGVHQISSDSPDLETAQITISDIIDVLNRFDTPSEVLTVMFRTPPSQMYVFSAAEVSEFGINRGAGASSNRNSAPERTAVEPDDSAPATRADRSARVAVYVGLDFYGGDVGSVRAPDLEACASQCASSNCRAFTFNADERARRGPNCFMKNGKSRPDGNSMAVSGVFLAPSEPDPEPLEVGVIDPRSGLLEDVDIPFKDLSKKPAAAKTVQACRMSCVADGNCEAFTFVNAKKQCWLKSSVEGARPRAGMVSGAKTRTTFSPAQIIDLN